MVLIVLTILMAWCFNCFYPKERMLSLFPQAGQQYILLRILILDWIMVKKKNSMFAVKIVSEYDQEIPQSQTADKPVAS